MKNYTANQLNNPKSPDYLNDVKLIQSLITDRLEITTNPYSPLCERLIKLRDDLHVRTLINSVHEYPIPVLKTGARIRYNNPRSKYNGLIYVIGAAGELNTNMKAENMSEGPLTMNTAILHQAIKEGIYTILEP